MTEALALLILLTVIAAIITVVTPNLLYSIISLGAVGFLLAIAFLFLAAPDIAIVQIGVEVVSLVILIRATLGRETQMVKASRTVVGVAFAVGSLLNTLNWMAVPAGRGARVVWALRFAGNYAVPFTVSSTSIIISSLG